MFKRMLVCSDLSPASDALIQCVDDLKKVGLEEVVLAHVVYVINTPGLEQKLAEEARPVLERQREFIEARGIRVTVETPFGVPARTLHEVAEKHDVSAILAGSHGKGVLRAAVLGSVSVELLHLTRRPVLLARIRALEGLKSRAGSAGMFSSALFPTDFSETAERALDYMGKIARETNCRVTIMHALVQKSDDAAEIKSTEESARYLLDAKKRRLEALGAGEVGLELVHGRAVDRIIDRTREGDFSILVMGSQGKSLVKEVFIGNVAFEVIRQADVPVLLVPFSEPSVQ